MDKDKVPFPFSFQDNKPPPLDHFADKKKGMIGKYGVRAWSDANARAVIIYIALKFVFMLTQLTVGLFSRKIALISCAFHTALDCIALSVTVIAMVVAKGPPKASFSYGMQRVEVLAGLTCGLFISFVAAFSMLEATHRLYLPPDVHAEIIWLACLSVVVDVCGFCLFYQHKALITNQSIVVHHSQLHTVTSCGRGYNMHGVFLHVLADCIASGSVVIASILITFRPWLGWYPLLSLLGSSYVLRRCLPLLTQATLMLMQSRPAYLGKTLDRLLREMSFHGGVLEVRCPHWWEYAPGITVGTVCVRVREDADEQQVLKFCCDILHKHITHLTVQIDKDSGNWSIARKPLALSLASTSTPTAASVSFPVNSQNNGSEVAISIMQHSHSCNHNHDDESDDHGHHDHDHGHNHNHSH